MQIDSAKARPDSIK